MQSCAKVMQKSCRSRADFVQTLCRSSANVFAKFVQSSCKLCGHEECTIMLYPCKVCAEYVGMKNAQPCQSCANFMHILRASAWHNDALHSAERGLIPSLFLIPPFGYPSLKRFPPSLFFNKYFLVYQALYTGKATN